MGLSFYRRRRTSRRSWVNVSRRGLSTSARLGRLTLNSRGRFNVRLPGGLRWRGRI